MPKGGGENDAFSHTGSPRSGRKIDDIPTGIYTRPKTMRCDQTAISAVMGPWYPNQATVSITITPYSHHRVLGLESMNIDLGPTIYRCYLLS